MRHAVAAITLAFSLTLPLHAATLPSGFSETSIGGLSNPTAMAMAPDGRIFVCQQDGALRVIKNNALLATPFVTFTVESSGERGLLGIAFDPNFLDNQYVYVYYTATTPAIHNRISRLTAAGDVMAAGSEVVLLNLENLSATNHNGGALHFGRDGKLYAGVGENAVKPNSQTLTNLLGKVLRINKDGTIPTDNPFYGTATGNNRAIWALGLRNPFTFNVHPLSGRIFLNDVGEGAFEEINDGIAGGNYGWPDTEGPTSNPSYISPVHHYPNQNAPECAIAGGTFYAPEVRQFPNSYVDSYLFSDLCGGWIRQLNPQFSSSGFATGISQPVDQLVGHDGSLYYLARGSSAVVRVRWNQHLEGDVNGDSSTNMADAFYLTNYLHGSGPAPVSGGDVDNNGVVNAADLTYLVSYLLGRGPTPV
ncbi:MAG TPA: PQQ-dependent sugar dehydrogenase [Thermoanaerobaculia bacterium]|jgi:glucose/arabinose dehydrogenase|nr:PQQ-dependent sugar dehydrogenase [Thermoanaerobaculia bacterium]